VKIYAFDVDETLELSAGPIPLSALSALATDGYIVGLCGNWALVVQQWANWPIVLSFLGPMLMTKAQFLGQLKAYIPADEYIMVGNVGPDDGEATAAGWRFIAEVDFAAGAR
jgi:hypothetical protein